MASAEAVAEVLSVMERADASLAGESSAEFFVELAIDAHSRSAWSSVYTYAMAFYAMHQLAKDRIAATGAAGPIMSKRQGKVAVSYMPYSMSQGSKALTSDDADLETTVWGRRYLALRKQQTSTRLISGSIR